MAANQRQNIETVLESKGHTLASIFGFYENVRETHEAVQRISELKVSERQVRRWLEDDELI